MMHSTKTAQEARRLYAAGNGYHKIAKLIGVSRWTVRDWIRHPAPGYTPPTGRPAGRPFGCVDLVPGARVRRGTR